MVNVHKALIVGDFNIHIDNTNDALGLAFTDLINSFGVKHNVTGPTHGFKLYCKVMCNCTSKTAIKTHNIVTRYAIV